MAAEILAKAGHRVAVFDRAASPARKFLLAGRGGLNLTHAEPLDRFQAHYGAAAAPLASAIAAFAPDALRDWCAGLGQPTFVGTSGRVFPESFKSSPLLRAWLRRLVALGVELRPSHRLAGIDESGALLLEGPKGPLVERADAIVLACGGASWPRLGADGAWVELLCARGVKVSPLRPANCAFNVAWSASFKERFAGAPLKAVTLSFAGARVRGEAIVTASGLEGGAVYTLASSLREAIDTRGDALLEIDLKPDVSIEALIGRLERPRGAQSTATFLRKAAALPPIAIALLREAGPLPADAGALGRQIKRTRLRLTGVGPIARAISSAGGIVWSELNEQFMLRRLPGFFAAGEMIDWEAPTGGYLLQACFATGVAAGRGAALWMERLARPSLASPDDSPPAVTRPAF
jgi:uncharacterized flavoprotein (TIGR03862 family)